MTEPTPIERVVREHVPRVLAALVRRSGDFDAAEDAVQDALVAAVRQWPERGVPDSPGGWLATVASRRLIEHQRAATARRLRELEAARPADAASTPDTTSDDGLRLLFLCCHPSLTPGSQVALTLRAVGGLTTAEIARAFLVPESAVAQRISRAKATIRASGGRFEGPADDERGARLAAVEQTLYLVFNEGYTATTGNGLVRPDLTAEAIRLTRLLHAELPDDAEVSGLLALMLLTDARRPARVAPDGSLVPLTEQDRQRWDRTAIDEGLVLTRRALTGTPVGPYGLQAAIAALHDEAPTAAATDWAQIHALYVLLETVAPGPMVTLNRIVAHAMVNGPAAALARLDALGAAPRLRAHHRLDAVRAHLLEMGGDRPAAARAFRAAAARTLSIPERRYLEARARAMSNGDAPASTSGSTGETMPRPPRGHQR